MNLGLCVEGKWGLEFLLVVRFYRGREVRCWEIIYKVVRFLFSFRFYFIYLRGI